MQAADNRPGSFSPVMARNSEVLGSNSDRVRCLSSSPNDRGCAYTVLLTVQRHGVCSAVYGTVHNKQHFKSFDMSTV